MARSWLIYVAILTSLVAGTVCSTALADNKFSGSRISSGGAGGASRGSVMTRPSGNFGGSGQVFKAPSRVSGNGSFGGGNVGGQVLNKAGGNVVNKPPLVTRPPVFTGPKPPVVAPKLPIVGGGSGGLKINPTPIVGGGFAVGASGGLKPSPLKPIVDKVGGSLKVNPMVGDKLGGITIGPKPPVVAPAGGLVGPKGPGILPGGCFPPANPHCTPCNPFQPGLHPWWFCPAWVSPAHCQPVVYTEPIIVPVSVPAPPVVVTVPVEVPAAAQAVPAAAPAAPAEAPAATEASKPATTTPEEKLLQVPLGATLTLQAKELGEQAGQVIVQIDKIALPALVSEWSASSVTATLPTLAIAENLRAELLLVKADGQVASSVKVELTPAVVPALEGAKLAGDPSAVPLPASLAP